MEQFEADCSYLVAMGVARRSFAALETVQHALTASRLVREALT